MRSIFSGLIASSVLLLVGCGGGGGGSTPPPSPTPPQAQSITFTNAGPVSRPMSDGTFTNAASGGAGTGAITYQSSNTTVATVNASGVVAFVAAGSTTITANKAADAGFLAASASYTLTITAPVAPQPQIIAFATPGAVTRPLTDGSLTNVASGGAGAGAITYQSSNTAVATVSNAGVVAFVAAGTVTITASKAADANYLAATASYSLTITLPVVAQPQTIAFASPGPVSRPLTDSTFVNAASGGAGTGAISYQSSNTAVATVAGAGVVTFVTAGTVTITASKAADANYLAATAGYSLTITSPASGATSITAWVGEFNTQVSFPAAANGLDFLRTTQLDCDVAQFTACADHQASVVGSGPMLDTAARLTRDAMWWLRSGATASAPMKISLQRFGPRASPTVGSFRGKLWVVGGSEWNSTNYVPVWNSDDGVNWTPVATMGGVSFGSRAQLVEFNNRLYLIGGEGSQFGYVDDLYKDEVKSSADGITWTVDTLDAPWPGRYGHSSFVFNDRIWVIGGATHSTDGDDAWSSADGLNWVEETTDGPFGRGVLATVMNGRIWVVGGSDGAAYSASVYSSEDGRTWRTETTTAPFPGRSGAVFKALNGRLYLAAGQNDPNNGRANDVWSSADGSNWVEEAHEAPFMPRYSQGSTVHAGRIWVIGGDFRNPQSSASGLDVYYTNDVWSTSNGSSWREHSPHAGAFQASAPEAVAANGRIWIVGGNDMLSFHEEIASSTDGGQWTPAPAGARFPRRGAKGLVWFDNELWISGGAIGTDNVTQFADVWHSADGGSWTRATQTAAFGERYAHTMVTFNGQMYVIGGVSGTTTMGDVWRSSDGVNWTLAAAAPFDPRYRGRAVVFGGRLWIFGGTNDTGPLSDAWSTADGTTWRLETATVAPLPRYGFMLTVHAGRMFISGGSTLTGGLVHYDDVWSSADGIAWTPVTAGPRFTPRRLHGFLSFGNKLWVLGGVDAKYPYNDIWSSDDNGLHWRMRYASEVNIP